MTRFSFHVTSVLVTFAYCSGAWAGPGDHFIANHCEIFLDSLDASVSRSHWSQSVDGVVKVLPFRLDGAVKEVGFRRTRAEGSGGCGSTAGQFNDVWRDIPLIESRNKPGSYYVPTESVCSDMHSLALKGAFYVVTTVGTTYWAKAGPQKSEDFVFEEALHDFVKARPESSPGRTSPAGDTYGSSVQTQAVGMEFFNPDRCC